MNYLNEYEKWKGYDFLDPELKEELVNITGDDKEIKERFIKLLEFGTAGLRGIIGAGTNRMNRFVVGLATQGLSNVIKNAGGEERGVVIAYDSRKNSDLFAKEAAKVFAANGIKVYLFDSLRPVPELSFAIRYLKTIAGVVITASHNPYQYNGYKAYWEDGSQLPPDEAKKVFENMEKISIFDVKRAELSNPLINIIGKEIDEAFYEEVLKLRIRKDVNKDIKIIYTPFHGAGNIPVREVLKRAGFNNVITVSEQEMPDPMFSTVKSPNPEDKEGFNIAIEYAKKHNANLILGTDPDCDRVGIVVLNKNGEFVCMTGNQVGVLLAHYILEGLKEQGKLPSDGAVIKSIVSTKMVNYICEDFNVKMVDILTGFKYIGEKIKEYEKTNEHTFLFGFEESYGYLSGTHARDKDGVNASMLIAEMAAYYNEKGMTLYDAMENLYEKYGYFKEHVVSKSFSGLEGMEKIKNIIYNLRNNTPEKIGEFKIVKTIDYLNGVDSLPKADVLRFELEDDTTIYIRASGTEPKIKGYIMVKADTNKESEEKVNFYKNQLDIILG
ncbi:MAG: phospho-sugar mutase [Ruminococcaceae bacterium]|nr:phospho-sugar mutase [Oscillospiraceae bacterium]